MKLKNILFYICLGLVLIGFILSINVMLFRGISFGLGLLGVFIFFILKTIKSFYYYNDNNNDFLDKTIQILIVLTSITIFGKYLYYDFWDIPSLIVIPLFIICFGLYLLKKRDKNIKITLTSFLYFLLLLPLFGLSDFIDSPPNQYLPFKWINVDENIEIEYQDSPDIFKIDRARELCSEANNYRKNKQFQTAIKLYQEALKLEPRNQFILFNLSTCYNKYSDLGFALSLLDKAIEIDSTQASFYNNRGIIHAQLGKKNEAISDYLKAIGLDSTDASFHSNLAFAYYSEREYYLSCNSIKNAELLGLKPTSKKMINQVARIKNKCE